MRISDWSSDVCSSDLWLPVGRDRAHIGQRFPLRACASRSHGDAMRMNVLSVRFPNGGNHRFVKACPPTDAGLANIRLEPIIYLSVHKEAFRVALHRSEERHVGKECVSPGSTLWSTGP